MKVYIDKSVALEALSKGGVSCNMRAHNIVASIPTADVVEVRHGRWLEYDGADKGFHYCSECKRQAFNYEDGEETIEVLCDWCPNCGALNKEDEYEDV